MRFIVPVSLLLLITSKIICALLHVENPSIASPFKCGTFLKFADQSRRVDYDAENKEHFRDYFLSFLRPCFGGNEQLSYEILGVFRESQGLSMLGIGRKRDGLPLEQRQLHAEISYQLTMCGIDNMQASFPNFTNTQELYWHVALSLWPANHVAAINLAHLYEWSGWFSAAKSLYSDCALLSGSIGCAIHATFVAPPLLWSVQQAESVYIDQLRDAFALLLELSSIRTNILQSRVNKDNELMPMFNDIYESRSLTESVDTNSKGPRSSSNNSNSISSNDYSFINSLSRTALLEFRSLFPLQSYLSVPSVATTTTTTGTGTAATTEQKQEERQGADALQYLREYHQNQQYLGMAPNVIAELIGAVINAAFPSLSNNLIISHNIREYDDESSGSTVDTTTTTTAYPLPSPNPTTNISSNSNSNSIGGSCSCSNTPIRVGIISEAHSNTSPGLCLHNIFTLIAARQAAARARTRCRRSTHGTTPEGCTNCSSNSNNKMSTKNLEPIIEFVFFDRPTLNTIFAEQMRSLSAEVAMLDTTNLESSRGIIAAAQLDILLYIGLPTEKFGWLLAQSRLAPVQVQYGVGHPIAAGARSIDYVIIAGTMLNLPSYAATSSTTPPTTTPTTTTTITTTISTAGGASHSSFFEKEQPPQHKKRLLLHTEMGLVENMDAALMCAQQAYTMEEKHTLDIHKKSVMSGSDSVTRNSNEMRSNISALLPKRCRVSSLNTPLKPLNSTSTDGSSALYLYRSDSDSNAVQYHTSVSKHSEQAVIFDSLSYFLPDPADMYSGDVSISDPLKHFATHRLVLALLPQSQVHEQEQQEEDHRFSHSCAQLQLKLEEWHIQGQVSANELGCVSAAPTVGSRDEKVAVVTQTVRMYGCIHSIRKFHPAFDIAILSIILLDREAKLVVLESFQAVLPRLQAKLEALIKAIEATSTNGKTGDDNDDRSSTSTTTTTTTHILATKGWINRIQSCAQNLEARFIFVDRLAHDQYLQLLSLTSVFLNPFPFGAGITSSEALAMCVPVIVSPSTTTVLHFALAQVRRFSFELADRMIVSEKNEIELREQLLTYRNSRTCERETSGREQIVSCDALYLLDAVLTLEETTFPDNPKSNVIFNAMAYTLKVLRTTTGTVASSGKYSCTSSADAGVSRGTSIITLNDLRDMICAEKSAALFGDDVLEEVTNEWSAFLTHASLS